MGKQELISAFEQARAELVEAISGLSEDEMLQPGAVGYWSVKDVLAHLTAWESELITALVRIEQGKKGVPNIVTIDDIDEWNDQQYRGNSRRDLQVILEDFHGVAKHLVAAIEAQPDQVLDDNRRFPWMEGEPLAYLVYENAIWHEQEHADEIVAWRRDLSEESGENYD
ncbi:MAG: DinB family protein [Chloroflexi bacterium]|nr:DinB family protein [Chloroflexota bacterium]